MEREITLEHLKTLINNSTLNDIHKYILATIINNSYFNDNYILNTSETTDIIRFQCAIPYICGFIIPDFYKIHTHIIRNVDLICDYRGILITCELTLSTKVYEDLGIKHIYKNEIDLPF